MPGLAATGDIYTVEEPVEAPRLSLFPVSLNSAKGHMYARLCTIWDNIEVNVINFPEENQSLDYARLCPNMTVPVLEIHDKIICDSNLLQKYLSTHYPGPGDVAAKGRQEAFIDKLKGWDEGLFTYRRMGSMGAIANDLRIVRLHQALKQALDAGEGDEELLDGSTVLDKYIWKIAQIHHLKEATSGEITPELEKKIAANEALTKDMFATASDLLSRSSGSFLFSDDLCSADGFLCAIVFRIEQSDPELSAKYHEDFPAIAEYWEEFKETDEAKCILPYTMSWAKSNALSHGIPFKILGMKTCIVAPPALPDDVEERIQEEVDRFRDEYTK